jgi:hypothetical protein
MHKKRAWTEPVTTLTVYMPERVYSLLVDAANAAHMSYSRYVAELVEKQLTEESAQCQKKKTTAKS